MTGQEMRELYEEYGLPMEATIEISELSGCCVNDEDEILTMTVGFLTDEFGFCIRNLDMSLEDEGLVKCSNIEWGIDD